MPLLNVDLCRFCKRVLNATKIPFRKTKTRDPRKSHSENKKSVPRSHHSVLFRRTKRCCGGSPRLVARLPSEVCAFFPCSDIDMFEFDSTFLQHGTFCAESTRFLNFPSFPDVRKWTCRCWCVAFFARLMSENDQIISNRVGKVCIFVVKKARTPNSTQHSF